MCMTATSLPTPWQTPSQTTQTQPTYGKKMVQPLQRINASAFHRLAIYILHTFSSVILELILLMLKILSPQRSTAGQLLHSTWDVSSSFASWYCNTSKKIVQLILRCKFQSNHPCNHKILLHDLQRKFVVCVMNGNTAVRATFTLQLQSNNVARQVAGFCFLYYCTFSKKYVLIITGSWIAKYKWFGEGRFFSEVIEEWPSPMRNSEYATNMTMYDMGQDKN